MATRNNGGASAPPIALPPVLAFVLGVPAAPRSAVEAVIEKMIDALDQLDGDAEDQQADGDELDGNASEDDFMDHGHGHGPGCPVGDQDYGIEDMLEGPEDTCASVDFRPIVDREAYREQVGRIRRDRCYTARQRGPWADGDYRRLIHEPETPTKRQLLRRKRGLPRRPRP